MQLLRKYLVLIGIVTSLILIMIAISIYPGGSMFNEYATGFEWSKNFMSNLFGTRALNGAENPSRIWACSAMIILPLAYAVFFINMSKKIPEKNIANILKYGGIANVIFTFLTVTHWHDLMLIISTTLFWSGLVIVSMLILKTKLHLLKFFCIISLAVFYYSVYLWGISDWPLLPIMQKVNFASSTLLVLALEYFTTQEDFAHIKPKTKKKLVVTS